MNETNSTNEVYLQGVVDSEPEFDHSVKEDKFYKFYLKVARLSGQYDIIPVIINKNQLEVHNVSKGSNLAIKGQFRSHNKMEGENRKLLLSVFVKETSIKVLKNYEELKNIIEPNCVNWKFSRINLVLIAILMLGIGEYKYVGNVDKAIIIDVCVKLAKKYGDEKDYRFINALLDKVL